MRIGISTCAGDGGKSGISQYMIRLLREFERSVPQHEFEAIVYADEQDIFVHDPGKIRPVPISPSLRDPLMNIGWHQLVLPGLCRKRGYDVLFIPAGNRRLCFRAPCPMVATVHDLAHNHVQNKYDPARHFYITRVLPFLIRRLDHVLTISEASRKDIVEFARVPQERVTVTPLGVDHGAYYAGDPQKARDRIASKYRLQAPYILYVSRIEHPGKNHVRLIRAFERLKQAGLPHQLVLAGSDWTGAPFVHSAAAGSPCERDILFTGFVPVEDLPDLYRAADLSVFPSLFEGFGLPVLEAMASGVPVACSGLSSLPEVAGDAAILFDPYDEGAIVNAIQALWDPSTRKMCVQRGLAQSKKYDWASTAELTLRVLETTAGRLR